MCDTPSTAGGSAADAAPQNSSWPRRTLSPEWVGSPSRGSRDTSTMGKASGSRPGRQVVATVGPQGPERHELLDLGVDHPDLHEPFAGVDAGGVDHELQLTVLVDQLRRPAPLVAEGFEGRAGHGDRLVVVGADHDRGHADRHRDGGGGRHRPDPPGTVRGRRRSGRSGRWRTRSDPTDPAGGSSRGSRGSVRTMPTRAASARSSSSSGSRSDIRFTASEVGAEPQERPPHVALHGTEGQAELGRDLDLGEVGVEGQLHHLPG